MIKDRKNESFAPAILDLRELSGLRDQHNPTYTRLPDHARLGEVYRPPRNDNGILQDEQMNSKTISRVEFWLGTLGAVLGFFVIAVGATWTISNSISDKINTSRQELTSNIQVTKSEITTRLDRVEDKMDNNFKDMSSGLIKIQATLDAEKDKSNKS